MPQLLTNCPDLLKNFLNDLEMIQCGKEKPIKRILKDCKDTHFCALPTGEFCLYYTKNVKQAHQLKQFIKDESSINVANDSLQCLNAGKKNQFHLITAHPGIVAKMLNELQNITCQELHRIEKKLPKSPENTYFCKFPSGEFYLYHANSLKQIRKFRKFLKV